MDFKVYLDNIVFSIQKFGGTSTYWKQLLKYFLHKRNVYMISQGQELEIYDITGQKYSLKDTESKYVLETFLPGSILRYLPLTKRLPEKVVYHNSYYRSCLQRNVVKIFTIHDFTHKKGYASKFPRKLVHITLTKWGLKNADGIICISENTKKDLLFYYPDIPLEKICVIYHGVSEEFFPLEKVKGIIFRETFSLDDTYIIFIGKRGGYKKFDVVLDALQYMKEIKLVIIGGGDLSKKEIDRLDKALPDRYFKMDGLDNTEINLLYNYSYALVYPSMYEGFGLPVIEAMKAGCPVITTNLSSIPEIAGEAALYMEDITSQAISKKLDLLKNTKIRKTYIERGYLQSKKFTWEKCASETYAFYKYIHEQKFGVIAK